MVFRCIMWQTSMESNQQTISESDFWRAISILLRNYHAINKKLSGVKIVRAFAVKQSDLKSSLQLLESGIEWDSLPGILAGLGIEADECPEELIFDVLQAGFSKSHHQYLLVLKLFYKQNKYATNEIIQVIDFPKQCFQCIPLDSSQNLDVKYKFDIHFRDGLLHIDTTDIKDPETKEKTLNWINYVLKPKLLKWSQSTDKDGKGKVNKSLSLIDIEDYTHLYAILKDKYGRDMVDRWTETTDPLKFVYEDVAIATYLILLWKTLAETPSKFIDMGCGNGLLVHILNSEGFQGYGVDVRKRKIWDIYPETTKLVENTIIPTQYDAYKEVDWIIGNHSDELSPWIPVIAAMSSYNTKFFLLPCCAYEFSGKKFQRRCCKASIYNDFLDYIQCISLKCRFRTDVDRLKIPSTKRVAVIGSTRLYAENDHLNVCQEVENFIKYEMDKTNCSELKLREKVEPVRNCTKIDKSLIDNIIMNIFKFILEDDDHNLKPEKWRTGRIITLGELAGHLTKVDLKNIKSECGGLKTLIKNKHDIFEVLGDKVKLRYPRKKEDRPKGFQYKRRLCFFFFHHPDGCPLNVNECTFLHEEINI